MPVMIGPMGPEKRQSAEDVERGRRIAELIADQGFSSTRFAEEIGVSKNAMTSLTKGYSVPSTETLTRICEKCRVFPEWILFGREPKRLPPSTPVPKITHTAPTRARGHKDLVRWLNGTSAGKSTSAAEKRWLKTMDWPEDEDIPDSAFQLAVRAYREIYGSKKA